MALPTFFTKLFSSYGNAPRIKESVTLPAQASQNGKFLKTDGTNTSWDSIPEYADATTSAHGLMSASDKTAIENQLKNVKTFQDWRNAPTGISSFKYEGDGTQYGAPNDYCIVITSVQSSVRGVAIAIFWINGSNGKTYTNNLHDGTWGTWVLKEAKITSDGNSIRYQSGLQICWGYASSNGTAVTFSVPFSAAPFATTSIEGSGRTQVVPLVCSTSSTTIQMWSKEGTYSCKWIAIGYWG